ncbi:hypothetical protein ACF0H5_006423 [Mactra antiquata]
MLRKMKKILCICILIAMVFHACLAGMLTEYKNIQLDGYVTEQDTLKCQLIASRNTSYCAFRIDTMPTDGVIDGKLEQCELLPLNWYETRVTEPGYTYIGKSSVSYSPPYAFHQVAGPSPTWEILQTLPLLAEIEGKIIIQVTPPAGWTNMTLSLRDSSTSLIYEFMLSYIYMIPPPFVDGIKSTLIISFETSEIILYIDGNQYMTKLYTGPLNNLNYLHLVFFDSQWEVSLISYKAMSW